MDFKFVKLLDPKTHSFLQKNAGLILDALFISDEDMCSLLENQENKTYFDNLLKGTPINSVSDLDENQFALFLMGWSILLGSKPDTRLSEGQKRVSFATARAIYEVSNGEATLREYLPLIESLRCKIAYECGRLGLPFYILPNSEWQKYLSPK